MLIKILAVVGAFSLLRLVGLALRPVAEKFWSEVEACSLVEEDEKWYREKR